MKRVSAVVLALIMIFACSGVTAYARDNMILNINSADVSHDVSDHLYGINMEDVAYSCDGGLVAELVNNGSFEYNYDACPGWDLAGRATISANLPMHENNPDYAVIHMDNERVIIRNNGFDYPDDIGTPSMPFSEKAEYRFSCYVRNVNFKGSIGICLDSDHNDDNVVQLSGDSIPSSKWVELKTKIRSSATENGSLAIVFDGNGDIQIDMVSLVPVDSYGYGTKEWCYTTLRRDIVEAVRALNPAFIRFPGGCLIEGADIHNMYNWKNTVGPLSTRLQMPNIHEDRSVGNYYNNTSAMGYHEYFQLCRDIGAEAVPVVNAGIACLQKSGYTEHYDAMCRLELSEEQWTAYLVAERGYSEKDITGMEEYTALVDSFGIKSRADYDSYIASISIAPDTDEFTDLVRDILDLIEYANGDPISTYLGALRAENGREQPFDLKYICIGNEVCPEVYNRNFAAIRSAVEEVYPDIVVISAASYGDASGASDDAVMTDEHFVCSDDTMLDHATAYDSYDRDGADIMVGSFARVNDGNTMLSAVQESAVMVGMERNGDIVKMAAVGTAIAREGTDIAPSALITYSADGIALSPNYYSLMLFAANTGNKYINTTPVSDGIYQSVTVDENTNSLYVKLVNTTSSGERVTIHLDGFDDIGYVSALSVGHKFSEACNTVGKQAVAPEQSEPEFTADSIEVNLAKNSVNVVRIACGDNSGMAFSQIPDFIDTDTTVFISGSAKVLIVVLVIGFAVGTAIGFVLYNRVVRRGLRRKNDGDNQDNV